MSVGTALSGEVVNKLGKESAGGKGAVTENMERRSW